MKRQPWGLTFCLAAIVTTLSGSFGSGVADNPSGRNATSSTTSQTDFAAATQTTRLALAVISGPGSFGILSSAHFHDLVEPPLPPLKDLPRPAGKNISPDDAQHEARMHSYRRVQNFLRRGVVPPIQPKPGTAQRPKTASPAESTNREQLPVLPELPDAPPPVF